MLSSSQPDFDLILADFGLSIIIPFNNSNNNNNREEEVEFPDEIVGTEGYMAPEMERGEHYGFAIDLWSVGIVFKEYLEAFQQIPSRTEESLLNILLSVTPENRTTASQLLHHCYFRDL